MEKTVREKRDQDSATAMVVPMKLETLVLKPTSEHIAARLKFSSLMIVFTQSRNWHGKLRKGSTFGSLCGVARKLNVKRVSFHMYPHAMDIAQRENYIDNAEHCQESKRSPKPKLDDEEKTDDTAKKGTSIQPQQECYSNTPVVPDKFVATQPLLPPPPPPMGISRGPPPPPPGSKGAVPPPPPPHLAAKGGGHPPPPGLACLGVKKTNSKLKRSPLMGNLYRLLKEKIEGPSLDGKLPRGRKDKVGAAASGGKQGMADAIAEITKRSPYFRQIEEDVKNYAETVKDIQTKIISFETSDMSELVEFHKYVESHLEKLSDETQVLARFEDFPSKKLEVVRMAAALYPKLDSIASTLQKWPMVSPLGQLLDEAESYFNKIKVELETLERTKDEEVNRFKAQKISFDFGILMRIKELMVDVSSSCVELTLKERRANENRESRNKPDKEKNGSGEMMWRAFQFAFRVYTFAGGHDDRADKLTRELAEEIKKD